MMAQGMMQGWWRSDGDSTRRGILLWLRFSCGESTSHSMASAVALGPREHLVVSRHCTRQEEGSPEGIFIAICNR